MLDNLKTYLGNINQLNDSQLNEDHLNLVLFLKMTLFSQKITRDIDFVSRILIILKLNVD